MHSHKDLKCYNEDETLDERILVNANREKIKQLILQKAFFLMVKHQIAWAQCVSVEKFWLKFNLKIGSW